MGDRYSGMIKCPYCKKKTEFYYALSSGITKNICEHCNKTFKIILDFKGVKIKN